MYRTPLRKKILTALGLCLLAFVTAVFAVTIYLVARASKPETAHEYTYYGPQTNILATGTSVILTEDFSAATADQAITGKVTSDKSELKWGTTPKGDIFVSRGTRGVVKLDPAWDEDSCYPERPVAVELSGAKDKDMIVALPRNVLHR